MYGRLVIATILAMAARSQEAPAPSAPSIETREIEKVDIAPLAPPEMSSPYASPRDAARHRFQSAMAELAVQRDMKIAIRQMAETLATDPQYAPAAFNLGLLCAVGGKWQDAVAALTEAARLDPGQFRAAVEPQLERLRLIATLESTPEGQRTRLYDEALYSLLKNWKQTPQADAAAALVQIGRVDPRRWEAPALLAGLLGDGRNYEAAAKFLEIAAANTSDAVRKAALQKAVAAAQREIRYEKARRDADIASMKGEYDQAGQMYEVAWKEVPARADAGIYAASAFLLTDDTARASTVLQRLRYSTDQGMSTAAAAMLKQLEPIESAAKGTGSGAGDFFRDPGQVEPARIADLVPVFDKSRMELLARPLPRMVLDPGSVTLLESLSAERTPGTVAPTLPAVAAPRLAGDRPWTEIQQLVAAMKGSTVPNTETLQRNSAEYGAGRVKRAVAVDTKPAGASLSLNDSAEPVCVTPCDLQIAPGTWNLKLTAAGFEPQIVDLKVGAARQEINLPLEPVRGHVLIDAPAAAVLEVNGQALLTHAPVDLAVIPGLHRFSMKAAGQTREQTVMVRPATRLRLNFVE